jgi:predicted O-linked N-acetylglucosamine transferase (SPINDLY family)
MQAEQCYNQAAQLQPTQEHIYLEWSQLLFEHGDYAGAIPVLRQATRYLPESAELHYRLAYALNETGQHEESMKQVERCLVLAPDRSDALLTRGLLLRRAVGHMTDAEHCFLSLIERHPNLARAHASLAGVYKDQGRIEEAIPHNRRAAELDADNALYQHNLLMHLHYSAQITPQAVYAAHWAWGRAYGIPTEEQDTHTNPPDPDRTLRIGYVSPDFREHSVAWFIEALFAHHDAGQFTVHAYSNLDPRRADTVTERLRSYVPYWRDIARSSDTDLTAQIRDDRIDLLIDLAGHTGGNRLGAFVRHPAPVQITYLGYPGTTGLPAMDYRLTDHLADPEDSDADRLCSENLIHIPHGFLCYSPYPDAPNPGPPSQVANGFITFGSFNNLAKINDTVISTWASVLNAVPCSRLVLKGRALADSAGKHHVVARFATHGVDATRLELFPATVRITDHLAHYRKLDIALDTFPYNGTTTTCEALWMGVPVIALAGDRHAGRVGVSLLTQLGLEEFIAKDRDHYIAKAVALARDPARLRELRTTLRTRMAASTLCDGKDFTHRVESVYRDLWARWCAAQT